jgi:RNA polymerase sigma-70 factor (ECF subfamily)
LTSVSDLVADVHASEWGRIVGGLIRVTGDWSLAEDATQDAFATALTRWPIDGIPNNPGAWLTTTARNRAIDRLRSAGTERARAKEVSMMGSTTDEDIQDDRLRLIFTCCHPALPLAARVALTLRTVAGLTVAEIASSFVVPEATMAQRLVRARQKISHAGIPYRVPPAELLGDRLGGVLAVIYLAFNEGYSSVSRNELADTAVRLASAVVDLMPTEPEARGLLALLLLQNSRRDARVGRGGELLTLEEQDRSLWHRDEIDRGLRILSSARSPYMLQASIAACHARAASADSTDWASIVTLYDSLLALGDSPTIQIGRAIALGMRDGPSAGLDILDSLSLPGYRWLPAAQGDLLLRTGDVDGAVARFLEALALTTAEPERADLERRIALIAGRA